MKFLLKCLFLLIPALPLSGKALDTEASSLADEMYKKAMKHAAGFVEQQDLTKAFSLYKSAADMGHTLAMTNLAHHYYLGAGTDRNLEQAFKWFNTACSHNEPMACKALGAMYAKGEYVQEDIDTAIEKYQVSADLGDPEAMLSIADILLTIEASPEKHQRAVALIRESAKLGHPASIYRVGLLYYYGEHIERDLVLAYAWIDIASIMQEESAVKAKPIVKNYLSTDEVRRAYELSKDIRRLHFAERFREL